MSFMSLICACINCGTMFTCNPETVPSIRVNGEREAVCRSCVEKANAERAKRGLPPFTILPGAYDHVEVP